ncbi:transmembrane domain-containing protein [Cryptosporidium canis]|uniref:Transmembrane domain-containing protein n=1 Tax=Cryptosporidium canis TaxID=195482 RepID=A0ABQ8P5C0_9CRYT|nr:transmembrane domain-containing protein [Cryptosporidium canis]KAJ1608722.1 transmembrane domain-containing protein [Cryptosporidium canis]
MEKFRQFADESTGVNPFIPVWGQTRPSVASRVLGVPMALARTSVLLVSLGMFAVFSAGTELMYLEHLRVIFYSVFLNGLSRVILLCLGCVWMSETLDKGVSVGPGQEGESRRSRRVIYVNRQGFCDILVCSSILGDPEYLFMESSGVYLASSSWSALLFTLGFRSWRGVSRLSSASKLKSQYSLRPLVLFMEEANTNGTCILEWRSTERIPDTCEMRRLFGENLESMVIKYKLGSSYGPQFTTGDLTSHLLGMLSKITYFEIDLGVISREAMKGRMTRRSETDKTGADPKKGRRIDDMLISIQNIQGKSSGLPVVSSGAEEAAAFTEYWRRTSRGKSV